MRIVLSSLFVSTSLIMVAELRAAPIAADSFATTASNPAGYAQNSSLYGQNVNGGNFGFTGAYTNGNANTTGAFVTFPTGLAAPADNSTGGGSVQVFTDYNSSGAGISRAVSRALSAYTASGTYYFSGLIQAPATFHSGAQALMGFTNNNTGSGNGSAIPATALGVLFGVDNSNFVAFANNTAGTAFTENTVGAVTAGSTNFFVAKLVYNSPTSTALNVWLNPSNTSSESALGTPTLTVTTGALADSTADDINRLNFGVNTSFANATMTTFTDPAYFDEPRFATDFSSVINSPEPTSMSILAIGATAALGRRRVLRTAREH